MKNILTLTDFSDIATNAVESAFVLAKQHQAKLFIYHSVDSKDIIRVDLNTESDIEMNKDGKALNEQLSNWKSLAKEYDIQASYLVGGTQLMNNVKSMVDDYEIDLIIMGSTGAGGKKEYFWGSNTEAVVKKVKCPVLVIKRPLQDYRMDNIVFASSFETKEKDILKYALNLLNPPEDAMIHLLSVDTPGYYSQPTIIIRSAMQDFEELVKPFKSKSYFYADYSVDAGIRHFLEEVQPDVLIMNDKFDKPLKHLLQGSNTLRAVNHSDFPVLTVDYK